MANKSDNITIDLKGWMTQVEYARQNDIKLSTVSQWVKRQKDGTTKIAKLQYLEVPQLGITLVKPL